MRRKSKNPDEAEDSARASNNVRSIRSADGPPLEPELDFNNPSGKQVHTLFANCFSYINEDIFVSSLSLLVNFLTLIMYGVYVARLSKALYHGDPHLPSYLIL